MESTVVDSLLELANHESDSDKREAAMRWLNSRKGTASIALVLRPSSEFLNYVESGQSDPFRFFTLTDESVQRPLQKVRDAWACHCRQRFHCNGFLPLPGIHSCLVRGNPDDLRALLDSRLARNPDSPIVGYVYADYLGTPEAIQSMDGSQQLDDEEI